MYNKTDLGKKVIPKIFSCLQKHENKNSGPRSPLACIKVSDFVMSLFLLFFNLKMLTFSQKYMCLIGKIFGSQ